MFLILILLQNMFFITRYDYGLIRVKWVKIQKQSITIQIILQFIFDLLAMTSKFVPIDSNSSELTELSFPIFRQYLHSVV